MSQIDSLLRSIEVPDEFSEYDALTDEDTLTQLEIWKVNVKTSLEELCTIQNSLRGLSVPLQARIVSAVARFAEETAWATTQSVDLARQILALFAQPSQRLLETILTAHVKPIFKTNPHPSLNINTGRKLARPAGGPMASVDYYDEQPWKRVPGAFELVLWSVQNMESGFYDQLWHLIIPPVMTLLDDYTIPHKIHGIRLVSEMLNSVPITLLKRTGVDALMFSSLNHAINHHLKSPGSPDLLLIAVPTIMKLIEAANSAGSAQKFDQMCTVLGDGIIGGVWAYGGQDQQVMLASFEVLPGVLSQIGIGCVRYLKALIPLLVDFLQGLQPQLITSEIHRQLQLASGACLLSVIQQGAPRMNHWTDIIISGIARCWTDLKDSKLQHEELENLLRLICDTLAQTCPTVIQDEYARLLQLDSSLFSSLINSDIAIKS